MHRAKKHIPEESSSSDSSSSSPHPSRHKKGKKKRKKYAHKKRHRRSPSPSSSSSTSPTSTDSDSSHRRRHKAKKAKACSIASFGQHVQAMYKNVPLEEKDELSFAACSDFIALALVHKGEKPNEAGPLLESTLHGGVDKIVAPKTKLEMDEILAPDSQSPDTQPSFVLVEGPPGIGKTTFCRELCRKWDTLKHVQDYKIVLHLKLRQKQVQNVKSLSDLLGLYRKSANQEVVEAMLKCSGEGVLFVLDGFDEMPVSIVSKEDCLLMEIIRGEYHLPKATRLVTSRPSALHNKNKHFPPRHRHVEILGFTDERTVEFAESAFKSEPAVAEHFKTFILSNPVINSLMYIPVNCAILARVYKDMRRDVKLMLKTMTQLFKVLVSVLIKRDMVKRGKWDEDTPVPSFKHLPGEGPRA